MVIHDKFFKWILLSRATVALSSNMTPNIPIDLVNPTVFKESEWIGANKEYCDVPTHVSDAKSDRLSVPQSYEGSFPSPDLPVTDFLALRLPRVSNSIVTTKLQLWFSNSEPTTNPDCLFTRAVPSPQFLKRLDGAFDQAWFDAAKSIVDPRFNESQDHLPLWTLGFWKQMVSLVQRQEKWAESLRWVRRERNRPGLDQETQEALDDALATFDTIGWDCKLGYLQGATSAICLPDILGTAWLSDDHIDMMMEELTKNIATNADMMDRVMVAPLAFANEIAKNGKAGTYDKKGGAVLLCRYEKHITEKKTEKLLFPVHINKNHWIAAFIDFHNGKIGYGK